MTHLTEYKKHDRSSLCVGMHTQTQTPTVYIHTYIIHKYPTLSVIRIWLLR